MKGSVLIIGSLLWDKAEYRDDWRNKYLDIENKKSVSAPIRYGRLSGERGIYTMVFSSRCLSKNKQGKGVLVPLKLEKYSIQKHCQELVIAERPEGKNYEERFNYGFFALGLLPNPNSRDQNMITLVKGWSSNFKGRFNPDQYKVDKESPIITSQGFLNIPWSGEFEGNDFIICTVIKTETNRYPGPKKVAERMKKKSDYEYFNENQRYGISTFQDKQIKANLADLH